MSTHNDMRRAAAKDCPKCHKLMKAAVINGKNVWVCVSCGTKTEAADDD